MEGARTLSLAGSLPPVFASQPELVLYAVAFLLGVLPVIAIVRWRIVSVTTVVAALAGVGAFFLYDQLPVFVSPPLQAAAVALGVFVVLAGGLGAVGGTRVPVRPRARRDRPA
jgi:hypothetical protein